VKHFFTKYCRENEKYLDAQGNSVLSFQPEVLQILMEHNWPGNVRELENAVERAVVLATDPSVPLDVLPDHLLQASGIRLRRAEGGALPADASLFEIVADFERPLFRSGWISRFRRSRSKVALPSYPDARWTQFAALTTR
jgi:DNA-binding NtrC family response regulator